MVGGGVVTLADDFEARHHIVRAHKSSECRTPIIVCEADGDPYDSICSLAKQNGSAVWHIDMSEPKNEQNALDYVEVGTQNGDWVYLTGNEKASDDIHRRIALMMMTLKPDPKKYPRREVFRLWLHVEQPLNINQNVKPVFPQSLSQNAILIRAAAPPGAGASSPEKMVYRFPQDPPQFADATKKHANRRDAGRDSDSESDADEPEKKKTGLWFHRNVDFYSADEHSIITKASEEIFNAIDNDDAAAVEKYALSGQVDLARHQRAGMTPLCYAVSREKLAAVKVLLEAGADPNLVRESDGCPPLFMAIESEDLLQMLIDAGADYYARYESYTLERHPSTAIHIMTVVKELKGYDDEATKKKFAEKTGNSEPLAVENKPAEEQQ